MPDRSLPRAASRSASGVFGRLSARPAAGQLSSAAKPVGLLAVLVAVLGLGARPALAAEDVVQFGNSIHVAKGATVEDTVCFFCSVNVEGTVNGDVVVFFGSARIDGRAKNDVVVFFGDVKAADDAAIGEDLVNFFGSTRLGENVDVGQDAVVLFGSLHAAETASIGGDRVVQPGWVFWGPVLAIALLVGLVGQEVRIRRRRRFLRGF